MKYLTGNEEQEAVQWMREAAEVARRATCERARCGSIVVNNGKIIGTGWNSPPQDREEQRRCARGKEEYHAKVTDKTCCIHAEQRAIIDALRSDAANVPGSRLYFIRLDKEGKPTKAGQPYCTICSKMALDCGVREFVLWHEEGVCVYTTDEYNVLSFQFAEKPLYPEQE